MSPRSTSQTVRGEFARRQQMWDALLAAGGPTGVRPALLRDLGIYGGAQGIWVNKEETAGLCGDGSGVTVGLLHSGASYPADLADDGVLYHYPRTDRPSGRDRAEINATKNAGRLGVPVFTITYPSPSSSLRTVHRGWVEDWDDKSQTFFISFSSVAPVQLIRDADPDAPAFTLFEETRRVSATAPLRNQSRFRFRVIQRYGPACAVCSIAVLQLLDAHHIGPKKLGGSDDPRNGLLLCANHHRAFDARLWAIDPVSLGVVVAAPHTHDELGLKPDIGHLPKHPHPDALSWVWSRWPGNSG